MGLKQLLCWHKWSYSPLMETLENNRGEYEIFYYYLCSKCGKRRYTRGKKYPLPKPPKR